MSQQTKSQPSPLALSLPVPSFESLLAIGAMLATLVLVAYDCIQSDDSAVRVRLIMQDAEVILVTCAAGFIASAVHRISVARDTIAQKIGFSADRALAGI